MSRSKFVRTVHFDFTFHSLTMMIGHVIARGKLIPFDGENPTKLDSLELEVIFDTPLVSYLDTTPKERAQVEDEAIDLLFESNRK